MGSEVTVLEPVSLAYYFGTNARLGHLFFYLFLLLLLISYSRVLNRGQVISKTPATHLSANRS